MKASGEACDSVTKNFFQGFDSKNNAFWNVACSNNNYYVIMVKNDSKGSTQIMSCEILKAVKTGECFRKF